MARRLTGFGVGVVFGVALSWTGMSSPEVIREALLFQDSYLYLMFAAAVATAAIGIRLLRAQRIRALLTGEPVSWSVTRPEPRHILGSLLFGVGWAISGACPGSRLLPSPAPARSRRSSGRASRGRCSRPRAW